MAKTKIIAEIGINHDGEFQKASSLISAAAESGAHAVKFQYRNLDNAYSSNNSREIGDEILLSEIRRAYINPKDLIELANIAHDLNIEAGISFFDLNDIVDFGSAIQDFDFFKLPSAELANAQLIDALLALKRHLYISTGCHSEAEIELALGRLKEGGWTPMHCISNYPLSIQNTNLGYITYLSNRWTCEVGYSSHDDYWESCLLAMQLGATTIERHITLDRNAEGLDHSSSSTPDEFARLATFAKDFDLLFAGNGPRQPNQGELLNRQNLGRSFYSTKDLPSGHLLAIEDLSYRSPNVGLNRLDIDSYLGKPLRQSISKGSSVTSSVFEEQKLLPDRVIDFSRSVGLALPVRLHDLDSIQNQFPIGAFEFHLSFKEVLSEIDISKIDSTNRYSIHLPDYINSTQLMDPFSPDPEQKSQSLHILERTAELAQRLQESTNRKVPVVGSFSVVHHSREDFFERHAELLKTYRERSVTIMPQWLPPIAWYFGGSVRLDAMNNLSDADLLENYNLPICLDYCHMIMGRNCFGFSADDLIKKLEPLVGHIHLADAAGIDGEGLAFGDGEPENLELFRNAFNYDCLKVIEVWQGHLNQGSGFRNALMKLEELYGS